MMFTIYEKELVNHANHEQIGTCLTQNEQDLNI